VVVRAEIEVTRWSLGSLLLASGIGRGDDERPNGEKGADRLLAPKLPRGKAEETLWAPKTEGGDPAEKRGGCADIA
jgi:hypothetical protein